MKILVTGAAGFIGSIVTELLVEQGHRVIALDNLVNGHRAAVHPGATFVQCDLLDRVAVKSVLKDNQPEAVVHLAAEALVDVSMRNPGLFFQANVSGGLNLLEAMIENNVKSIVFSSTAAVYGEPQNIPITEDDPCLPVNSYGESKLMFERILDWFRRAHQLKYVTLRYFNACGATARFGEYHVPETHIIPILFEVATDQRDAFSLYGTDYDTPDGTCIRDYIHVVDIARAHILALGKIDEHHGRAYNMGNTSGYSNRQVIEEAQQVTGKKITVVDSPRRPGDPARLVASSDRLRRELGWMPQYPDLRTMIETAWIWRSKNLRGYDDTKN